MRENYRIFATILHFQRHSYGGRMTAGRCRSVSTTCPPRVHLTIGRTLYGAAYDLDRRGVPRLCVGCRQALDRFVHFREASQRVFVRLIPVAVPHQGATGRVAARCRTALLTMTSKIGRKTQSASKPYNTRMLPTPQPFAWHAEPLRRRSMPSRLEKATPQPRCTDWPRRLIPAQSTPRKSSSQQISQNTRQRYGPKPASTRRRSLRHNRKPALPTIVPYLT